MSTKFYSDVDLKSNEAKGVVVENFTKDEMAEMKAATVKPKAGRVAYNATENKLGFWNGTDWVYGGESGALNPIGTLGVGADYEELPTFGANAGDAYFVKSDGVYEGKRACIGDFYFARPRTKKIDASTTQKIWKDLFSVVQDKSSTDPAEDVPMVFVKGVTDAAEIAADINAPHIDTDGKVYFLESDTLNANHKKLFDAEGKAYVAPTGADDVIYFIDELAVDSKYYLKVKVGPDGTPEYAYRHEETTDAKYDIEAAYPVWALVPAGNGYMEVDLSEMYEETGTSEFTIDNFFHTKKVKVQVVCAEDNEEYDDKPYAISMKAGEVISVDTCIDKDSPNAIHLNFGHPLFPAGKGEEGDEHTKFVAQLIYG